MRPLIRRAVTVLLCGSMSACMTVQSRQEPVGQVAPHAFPQGVNLTLTDGRVIPLSRARLVADSVTGLGPGERPVSVATAEVASWEQRRFRPLRTAGLVVGAVVVVGLGFLILQNEPLSVLNPADR
jgi:hypothetical protein